MSVHQVLLLPHLRVLNANALSSPITVGFPAVTGFLGATHALQRRLNGMGFPISFDGVGIVCHDASLQTYKGDNDFVHSIIGTGNPLDKSGERAAFIEAARVNLDISLVMEVVGLTLAQRTEFLEAVNQLLSAKIKIAGGDILKHNDAQFMLIDSDDPATLKGLQRQLMPGYALCDRRDLMEEAMRLSRESDALDCLIDFLAVHHRCEAASEETVQWKSDRKVKGWIIPIATGYQGISELAHAKNKRDAKTLHRFAESIVTLGEFTMPHRLVNLNQFLWRYREETENDLYLCSQESTLPPSIPDSVLVPESDEFV